jgi:two-component system, NarL family, response regulator DevR
MVKDGASTRPGSVGEPGSGAAGRERRYFVKLASDQAAGDGTKRLRIFILDDHEVVRRGLQDLLEGEGFEIVGQTGSAREATKMIPALHPDVAVLDVRLPDGTGIEVCRDVRSIDPSLRCLILTSYDDERSLRSAVLAGAVGYVLKQISGNDLVAALRRAAAGETLFDPGIESRVVEGMTKPGAVDPRMEDLSPQEQRILGLIGQGLTNKQISEEMFLAEKTVKNYVSSVLAKLGFERRTQAAVYVAKQGADGADSGHLHEL